MSKTMLNFENVVLSTEEMNAAEGAWGSRRRRRRSNHHHSHGADGADGVDGVSHSFSGYSNNCYW